MICNYYLTWQCDSYCDFCPVWRDEALRHLPISPLRTIEKNLVSLKKLGVKQVNFTGGEPLMRDDIAGILSSARKQGLITALYTSGMLYPKKASELAGLIDKLFISIDFPSAQMHNDARGQECFQEAVDSLAAANYFGKRPIINFTITRDSIRFLPEMAELAENNKALLNVSPVHHCEGLDGFERISVDYILRYASNSNVMIDRQAMSYLKQGGNRVASPACRVSDNHIFISPDDRLMLPCFFGQQSAVPIEGKLEDIYRSDIVRGYKKLQGRFKACDGCVDPSGIDRSAAGRLRSFIKKSI